MSRRAIFIPLFIYVNLLNCQDTRRKSLKYIAASGQVWPGVEGGRLRSFLCKNVGQGKRGNKKKTLFLRFPLKMYWAAENWLTLVSNFNVIKLIGVKMF